MRKLEAKRINLAELCQLYRASSALPRLEDALRCHDGAAAALLVERWVACTWQARHAGLRCAHIHLSCFVSPETHLACRGSNGRGGRPFIESCAPVSHRIPRTCPRWLLPPPPASHSFAAPLASAHDEEHLAKFEMLLEASIDLDRVPEEYVISAAYDSRLQVRMGGRPDYTRTGPAIVREDSKP